MAKKALIEKQQRTPEVQGARATPAASGAVARTRVYRKFGLCRICLRELVHAGEIPGVTKASW